MADVRRLPGQLLGVWDWQVQALCRGLDSAMFFHPDREGGADRDAREATAKALCQQCPVQPQCRLHALTVREPCRVWGGLSTDDRTQILHRPR